MSYIYKNCAHSCHTTVLMHVPHGRFFLGACILSRSVRGMHLPECPHWVPFCAQFFYRIDRNGAIKVADFGLTEDMYGTNYYRQKKSESGHMEKFPIRWMAPESIENDIYNESTDMVSVLSMNLI